MAALAALCILGLFVIGILSSASLTKNPPALPLRGLLTGLALSGAALALYGIWWLIIGRIRGRERDLRNTRYALTLAPPGTITGGRALMRLGGRWPRFASWPITARNFLEIREDHKTGSIDIDLCDYVASDTDGDKYLARTGFRRLADGWGLVTLIRQIQTSCTSPDKNDRPTQTDLPP
ncbi:hypothetical protein HOY34_05490 [Xinfangfangia sp. D13-10-4-6]|uniref:hypothetical protein n=1 Tax=Pseudogemmobacter hezensis TaxID=2737662 RepID=UPI00155550FD|nr:hypothetical protein [Pseudogemmobacter hezensis]NPD14656.1 hypothetical protein [Pseudogemmobacter hezensis]